MKPLLHLSAGWPVLSLAFEPVGRALVTGGLAPNIQWWQPLTGQFLGVQRAHRMGIVDLAFIPQSTLIASASDDANVNVWDATTFGAPVGSVTSPLAVLRGAPQRLTALAASGDGQYLAASSFGQVLVWNPSSGELLQTLPHNGWVTCLAFSPDGQNLLTAEAGNRLQTWQRNGWQRTQVTLIVGWPAMRALAYSPDGNTLVTGHGDGSILFWDVASGELRFWLAGHAKTITSLAFDRAGKWLASASADGRVRIWDLRIQE
jgi:WD40 repeat protein